MIDDDRSTRSNDTSKAFGGASTPRPSSETERQRLLDSMAKPQKTLELTPDGTTKKEVNQQVDDAKLARVKQIEERLRNARESKAMKRSFDQTRGK